MPSSPRRGIRCSLALRIIIITAPFRLGHTDGALNQRALNSGRLWLDTDRSSRAGSSAPPAEIETPEDESERREGCDCEIDQYGFHGEDRTGGTEPYLQYRLWPRRRAQGQISLQDCLERLKLTAVLEALSSVSRKWPRGTMSSPLTME